MIRKGPARRNTRGDSRYTHYNNWYTRGTRIATNKIQYLKDDQEFKEHFLKIFQLGIAYSLSYLHRD